MYQLGGRRKWFVGRRRSLEPRAVRDVVCAWDGRWIVQGARPLIALIPDDKGPAPTGDLRLDLEFRGSGFAERATLVVDTGSGFAHGLQFPLRGVRSSAITALVTVPNSTVALAIDPGLVGVFQFGRMRLIEVSAVGAIVSHAIPQFRGLLQNPFQMAMVLGRAVRLFRYRGIRGVLERLRRGTQRQVADEGYEGWARRYVVLSDAQREALRVRVQTLGPRKAFSVLLGTLISSDGELHETLKALVRQIYPFWELCLAEENVPASVRNLVDSVVAREHVRWARGRDALTVARGDLVLRLEAGDVLAEDALFAVADAVARNPELALVYTDNDAEDATGHTVPAFKPDWSPEFLRSRDYVGRAAFLRTESVRALGGWREGAGDVPQHELLLRYTAQLPAERIEHLPAVLLSCRRERALTPEQGLDEARVIQESLEHAQVDGRAETGRRPGTIHVRYGLPNPPPLVTVVIPTKDQLSLLSRCIESLQTATSYQPLEILVVDNASRHQRTKAYLAALDAKSIARVLRYPFPFNFSAMNNLAVREARGDVLCLLNNDVEAIDRGWLSEMVGLSIQQGVGAVGAKLLYPDDRVQHAGTVAGLFGVAAHGYLREPRDADGYLLQLQTTREVAAVTAACMVLRRKLYVEVGGLDDAELSVAFNDVDLCFKLIRAGYRNLWTPYAELHHRESASRGNDERGADRQRFLREESVMRSRWGELIARDPYYSPNLSLDANVPRPTWPPRVVLPWRTAE